MFYCIFRFTKIIIIDVYMNSSSKARFVGNKKCRGFCNVCVYFKWQDILLLVDTFRLT